MDLIRFAAIVPEQGSAYFRQLGGDLVQVPILRGGIVEIPRVGVSKDGDEGEVDWYCAFESEDDAESVRAIERALKAIPDDLAYTIAPYSFSLSIQLGVPEMDTPAEVVNALRQAVDVIEALDRLDGPNQLNGPIYTASGRFNVGHYTGCLLGKGEGCGRAER